MICVRHLNLINSTYIFTSVNIYVLCKKPVFPAYHALWLFCVASGIMQMVAAVIHQVEDGAGLWILQKLQVWSCPFLKYLKEEVVLGV